MKKHKFLALLILFLGVSFILQSGISMVFAQENNLRIELRTEPEFPVRGCLARVTVFITNSGPELYDFSYSVRDITGGGGPVIGSSGIVGLLPHGVFGGTRSFDYRFETPGERTLSVTTNTGFSQTFRILVHGNPVFDLDKECSVSPANPIVGRSTRVVLRFINAADATCAPFCYYVDDLLGYGGAGDQLDIYSGESRSCLLTGDTFSDSFMYTFPGAGQHTLRLTVTKKDELQGCRLDQSSKGYHFDVFPTRDSFEYIRFSISPSPSAGRQSTVNVQLKNRFQTPIDLSYSLIDETEGRREITSGRIDNFHPGIERTIVAQYTPQEDDRHSIMLVLNPGNVQDRYIFDVGGGPIDAKAESLVITTASGTQRVNRCFAGQMYNIGLIVKNVGQTVIDANTIRGEIYITGPDIARHRIGSDVSITARISPNGTSSVRVPYTFPREGEYAIEGIVSGGNDSSSQNNSVIPPLGIIVDPRPEVEKIIKGQISMIRSLSQPVIVGEPITIEIEVKDDSRGVGGQEHIAYDLEFIAEDQAAINRAVSILSRESQKIDFQNVVFNRLNQDQRNVRVGLYHNGAKHDEKTAKIIVIEKEADSKPGGLQIPSKDITGAK